MGILSRIKDSSIAFVSMTLCAGLLAQVVSPLEVKAETLYELSGYAHVQNIGDTAGTFSDGTLKLGTRGQSLRLEAVKIDFVNNTGYEGSMKYQVHVQNIGWMDYVDAGSVAGTSGQSLRLEGIRICLTGELAKHYSVTYTTHVQGYGDSQNWVRDGAISGTVGESKRLEELRVRLVPVDEGTENAPSVYYRTHIQDHGWEGAWSVDGDVSGTQGKSKRLEAISMNLATAQYSGGISYIAHIENIGWTSNWSSDGDFAGTQGKSLRLEAIKIKLTGDIANYYDVYYRVHAQDYGWMNWASNGQTAGTSGFGKRLEAIQIVLVAKGGEAPGDVKGITTQADNAFEQYNPDRVYFDDFRADYRVDGALVGIDVSAWQKNIDFNKVKAAGCDFVIIRVAGTKSADESFFQDRYFLTNIRNAKAAGLLVGVYFYSTASTEEKVRYHANLVCDMIEASGVKLDFPVAFDWEEYDSLASRGMDYAALNHIWFCFADEMNKRGYDTMLYASVWYLSHCWNPYGHDVWAAHYTSHTYYKGDYILWQRTSVGLINGISGVVDLDVYYPGGH
ncbi:MAG: hypothetical protein K5745_02280 [Saccharofermentans sp.]|nr:hypothetical protein [Saccharofermentans sp.]